MSEQEDKPKRHPLRTAVRSLLPLAIGLTLALLLHLFTRDAIGDYNASIIGYVGISIILAVSLTMVNGFTGQFSIGHAGFMAIGGYTAAAIVYYGSYRLWGERTFNGGMLSWTRSLELFEGSFWSAGDTLFIVACLTAGLFAAIIGFIVGLPSLRLRGDYLAIVTLGFGEIVRVLLLQTQPTLTTAQAVEEASIPQLAVSLGGAEGFFFVPRYTTLFWIYLFATITLLTAHRLKRSTHGRAFLAIRENELAAEVMGVATTRYKIAAFVISSFFAGIAGALFAMQDGTTLKAPEFGFQKSFDVIIMVVLGGMGSISGAVMAAAIVTILPEVLRSPPSLWLPGLIVIGVILAIRRRRGLRSAAIIAGFVIAWELLSAFAASQNLKLSDFRMVIYALSLILMMIYRPQGLMGTRELWELPIFHGRFRGRKALK